MPATTKTVTSTKEKDRRKSSLKTSLVTLKVTPEKLQKLLDPTPPKEESPVKDSPATSTPLPVEIVPAVSTGENASSSNPGTPAAAGTPSAVPMGPPTEGIKKKGVKRAAASGESKARGKPGPKKKPRL